MTAQPIPQPRQREWIVVEFDYSKGGTYISAECQLGAHWGCSGGIRLDVSGPALICHCRKEDCDCRIKLVRQTLVGEE